MRFSIVIPSYNQGRFLSVCLESVLNQKGVELEVLVYDGGSSDNSREIIKKYASQLAYWQSQPDDGQAAVLREGFTRASGEILGWVNSDDLLLPNALAIVADVFATHSDTCLVYGDALLINGNGFLIRPKREIEFDYNIFAYGYCFIPQPTAFFSRKAYEDAGGIDTSFVTCMDYDLWHRMTRTNKTRYIAKYLAGIRQHELTKTNTLTKVFRDEEDFLRKKYLHCGRVKYTIMHVWHRFRRIIIRWRHGCYRELDAKTISPSIRYLQEIHGNAY